MAKIKEVKLTEEENEKLVNMNIRIEECNKQILFLKNLGDMAQGTIDAYVSELAEKYGLPQGNFNLTEGKLKYNGKTKG